MKKLITTMAVVLVAASAARADVLASWEFSGVLANAADAPLPTTHASVSVDNLSRSTGLDGSLALDWPSAWGVKNAMANGIYDISLDGSIFSGRYLSVSLTPDAGQTINFDNIVFDGVAGGTGSEVGVGLLSSLTGFATADVVSTNILATGWPEVTSDLVVDLSGVSELQGVDQAVEFRFYLWNQSGAPSRFGFGKPFASDSEEDLVFNGTVIPEPGTLGLLGFAAAGMFWFRKRFSR